MTDIRIYRGYIIPDRKNLMGNKWMIQFPDFPQLVISGGNEILKPDKASELAFSRIVDELIEMLISGREIPVPQTHLHYTLYIDLDIDVELLKHNLCLGVAN